MVFTSYFLDMLVEYFVLKIQIKLRREGLSISKAQISKMAEISGNAYDINLKTKTLLNKFYVIDILTKSYSIK